MFPSRCERGMGIVSRDGEMDLGGRGESCDLGGLTFSGQFSTLSRACMRVEGTGGVETRCTILIVWNTVVRVSFC